jgi:hypothetical protein
LGTPRFEESAMTTRSDDQTAKTNLARNDKSNPSRFTASSAINCEIAIPHLGDYFTGDAGLTKRGIGPMQ